MTDTPNLTLPYLAAGQAQKHVTLNETLRRLDALVQIGVLDRDLAVPPSAPVDGARYIVAANATGAWAGKSGQIAAFQDGGWVFYPARPGFIAFVTDEARLLAWDGAGWAVPGVQSLNPVDLVGIATTADTTNRLAVAAPAVLFTHAGAGHQVKINKNAAADTASLLFQTGYSGRAEFGLAGDDDFRIKVSANGTNWLEAISINRATGAVSLPNTAGGGGGGASLVKQVKLATKTTGFTTQSATPVSTGLALTITPQSASNRVIIRAMLTLGARFWYTAPEVTIRRNGVKVWPQGSAPSMRHASISSSDANSNIITFSGAIEFEDLPGATTAQTYEVFLASTSGAHNVHLNIREHDLTLRGESSLSATECAP